MTHTERYLKRIEELEKENADLKLAFENSHRSVYEHRHDMDVWHTAFRNCESKLKETIKLLATERDNFGKRETGFIVKINIAKKAFELLARQNRSCFCWAHAEKALREIGE